MFSDKENKAVCVLTNLNVASSTDSLCNSIFDCLNGKAGKINQDVWSIFDIVFTNISLTGIIIFLLVLPVKNSKILIGTDFALATVLALILILFPIIFQAGLKDIFFVWGPLSLSGGLLVLALDIVEISVKILMVKKNARDYKAG